MKWLHVETGIIGTTNCKAIILQLKINLKNKHQEINSCDFFGGIIMNNLLHFKKNIHIHNISFL